LPPAVIFVSGSDFVGKIAIIGSGPAGMHAALLLARQNHKVEIFEKEPKPGGMLQYYLPKFRFTREGIRPKVESLEKLGVKIHLNTKIGIDKPLEGLISKFDAVILAPGEWVAKVPRLHGINLEKVVFWTEFLRDYNEGKLNSLEGKAITIGGGNTAMDCARVAKRLGAESIVAYRRSREGMPADLDEIAAAEKDGVEIKDHLSPVQFRGRTELESLVFEKTKGAGRELGMTGEQVEIKADYAILAIGQQPDPSILEGSKYNSFKELPDKVILAGDIANEKKLIATAIASATAAAEKANKIVDN